MHDKSRIVLCAMRGDSSDTAVNINKAWAKEILFFKDHCKTEHEVHHFDAITNVLKHELEEHRLNEENHKLLDVRRKKISDNVFLEVQKAEEVAMKGLNKEIRYENLMEREMRLSE